MERKTLSIVIPAFNEEHRLPLALKDLREQESALNIGQLEVIVVDDGSNDQTLSWVTSLMPEWSRLRVYSLPQNTGKGAALREGVLRAKGDWVLLADADQSTPWDQLLVLWKQIEAQDADGAIASRGLAESEIDVRQNWFRQSLGRTFNLILRLLTGLPFRDTQCGFKLFRRDSELIQIFESLQTFRFAYDVEVLLALRSLNKKIVEVPVRWSHKDESRVHLLFDSAEMLWSVIKLRWRFLRRKIKLPFS